MKKSLCRFALLLLLLPAAALAESHVTGEGSDAPGDPTATVGEAPASNTTVEGWVGNDSLQGGSGSEELESVGCEDNGGCTDGNVCRDGTCVSAQGATKDTGFTALAPIPGLTDNINGAVVRSEDLANFLNNLYRYLIGLAAALAVIMITWGGIEWATQDIPAQKASGKEKIRNAIFGLVLILSPYVVFSIINPAILNLSIGLKPLNTAPTPYTGGPGTSESGSGPEAPATGCASPQGGQYFEQTSCASKEAAQGYSCKNGAKPLLPACERTDSKGNCLDKSYRVYCSQSTEVVYQKATHVFGLIPGWSSKVIPRDAGKEAAFIAGCKVDGGKVDSATTASGKLSIYTRPLNYLSPFLSGGCPDDSGVEIKTKEQYGVICYGQILACIP